MRASETDTSEAEGCSPMRLPHELQGATDVIISDPDRLSAIREQVIDDVPLVADKQFFVLTDGYDEIKKEVSRMKHRDKMRKAVPESCHKEYDPRKYASDTTLCGAFQPYHSQPRKRICKTQTPPPKRTRPVQPIEGIHDRSKKATLNATGVLPRLPNLPVEPLSIKF